MLKDPISIVMSEEQIDQEAAKEARLERYKAKLQKEFDEYTELKQFVIKHMGYLLRKKVQIEVGSVQLLETHQCLIINDLLLVSFTEAADMLYDLKRKEKDDKEKCKKNRKG